MKKTKEPFSHEDIGPTINLPIPIGRINGSTVYLCPDNEPPSVISFSEDGPTIRISKPVDTNQPVPIPTNDDATIYMWLEKTDTESVYLIRGFTDQPVECDLAPFTAEDIGNFETYTRAGDGESDGVYTITYVSTEGDTTQQEDDQ